MQIRITVVINNNNGNPNFISYNSEMDMDSILVSLEQGITPAILVIIYLLIIKIVDSKKESKQAKVSKQLADSVADISTFIKNMHTELVNKDKDKCKVTVEDSMMASCLRLINFVNDTILNNHIHENKDNIITNIHNIVNAEYYTIFATLSLYTVNGNKVSDVMKTEWMAEIEKDIIDIIYSDKLQEQDKINIFMHKITLRIQSYITYIINKAIK